MEFYTPIQPTKSKLLFALINLIQIKESVVVTLSIVSVLFTYFNYAFDMFSSRENKRYYGLDVRSPLFHMRVWVPLITEVTSPSRHTQKSSQHVRACATSNGAVCSKNRKIVPYHGDSPNSRISALTVSIPDYGSWLRPGYQIEPGMAIWPGDGII